MRKQPAFALLIGLCSCTSAPFGLRSLRGDAAPLPFYPAALGAQGVEGESVLQIVWRDDGTVDNAKTRRLRESHRDFTESVLAAARQWRRPNRHPDSLRVETQFALMYRRCTARDSAMYPASRATLRAHNGVLHILVEAGACPPGRWSLTGRSSSPRASSQEHGARE